jgi:hypothetical protein
MPIVFERVPWPFIETMLRPSHGIEDRLPARCDHPVDREVRFARLNIQVEVDLGENRVMHLLERTQSRMVRPIGVAEPIGRASNVHAAECQKTERFLLGNRE